MRHKVNLSSTQRSILVRIVL